MSHMQLINIRIDKKKKKRNIKCSCLEEWKDVKGNERMQIMIWVIQHLKSQINWGFIRNDRYILHGVILLAFLKLTFLNQT